MTDSVHLVPAANTRWTSRVTGDVRVVGVIQSTKQDYDASVVLVDEKRQLLGQCHVSGSRSAKEMPWKAFDKHAKDCFFAAVQGDTVVSLSYRNQRADYGCAMLKLNGKQQHLAVSAACDGVLKRISPRVESLAVRGSRLASTISGPVLALLVSDSAGQNFLVTALLAADTWDFVPVDSAFSMLPLVIVTYDATVILVRADVVAAADSSAPHSSVESALTDISVARAEPRVSLTRGAGPNRNGESTPPRCLHFRIASHTLGSRVLRMTHLQSGAFRPQPGSMCATTNSHPCLAEASEGHSRFLLSAVVPQANHSFLVQLVLDPSAIRSHPFRPVAASTPISGLTSPLALAMLQRGSSYLNLVLSQDYGIYAAFELGEAVECSVGTAGLVADQPRNKLQFEPPEIYSKGSKKKAVRQLSFVTMHRVGNSMLLCADGTFGTLLKLQDLSRVPRPQLSSALAEVRHVIAGSLLTSRQLTGAINVCYAIMAATPPHDASPCYVALRHLVPTVARCHQPAARVAAVQAITRRLTALCASSSTGLHLDWSVAAEIDAVLRNSVAKSVSYCDIFFSAIAAKQIAILPADERQVVAEEAARALSVEARQAVVIRKPLPEWHREVLDVLASGMLSDASIERWCRETVTTRQLSSGAWVVEVQRDFEPLLHAVGLALLTQCLDMCLFVHVDGNQIMCRSKPLPSIPRVSVTPKPISTKAAFDSALVLACDALSTGQQVRVDVALFAALLGRRYHAAVTLLQLFAVQIEQSCVKTDARERNGFHLCCTTALKSDADVLAFLLDEAPAIDEGVRLVVVLAHFLRDGSFLGMDEQLLQALRGRLPDELLLHGVAVVIHQHADHLVAAQNNFSTASMKSFLPRYASVAKPSVVGEYHKRLALCVDRLDRTFAVAEAIVNISTLRRGLVAPPAAALSMVSSTLLHDIRLLALVKHELQLLRAVEILGERVRAFDRSKIDPAATTMLKLPHVVYCLTALRMYAALAGTALPTEGLQQACLSAVDASLPLCSLFPQLGPFLREVLRLCQAERSSTIAIKRKFCALDDALDGSAPSVDDVELSRALQQATSLCKYHESRLEHYLASAGAAPLADHNLESRAFLINSSWGKYCWPAECETMELESVAAAAGSVEVCVGPRIDVGVDLGRALFAAICHLVPPVRLHTMAPLPSETKATPQPGPGPAATQPQPAPQPNVLVEVKVPAPTTLPPASVPTTAAPAVGPASVAALDPAAVKLSSTSIPTVSSPTTANGSPPNMAPSPAVTPMAVSAPPVTVAAAGATAVSSDGKGPARPTAAPTPAPALSTLPVATLVPLSDNFSPATVAWWEQPAANDENATRQRALQSSAAAAPDTDTATSYSTITTVTSNRRERNDKSRRSRSSSEESDRRRHRHRSHHHHHRCARHAVVAASDIRPIAPQPALLVAPAAALSPPRVPALNPQQAAPAAIIAPQLLSAPKNVVTGQPAAGIPMKLFNAFDASLDPAGSPRAQAPQQGQVALLAPLPLITAGPQLQPPLPPPSGFFLRPPPLAKRAGSSSSSSTTTSSSSSSSAKKKKNKTKKSAKKSKKHRGSKEAKQIEKAKEKKADVMMTEDLDRQYKKLADEPPLPPGIVAYRDEATGGMKISSAMPTSGNLSPLEDAQFRRYVDELLSRTSGAAPAQQQQQGVGQAPLSPLGAPRLGTDMAHADFLRQLTMQQQAMFQLHQESLVNAQRDNALLLRRAVEDLRGPPVQLGSGGPLNASVSLMGSPGSGYYGPMATNTPPQPSGLNAVQQSQLLQQTMDQREKLMRMNDQLLQMQQAAAKNEVASTRVSGVFQPSQSAASFNQQPQASFSHPPGPALQLSALQPPPGVAQSQPIPSSLSPTVRTDLSSAQQRPLSAKGVQTSGIPPTPVAQHAPQHFGQAPLSLQASMRELNDMNQKLSQVNASADDIERALTQSRELLRRHSSQNAASSLQIEQQAALEALKAKAASLEAQLLAGKGQQPGQRREFLSERTDGVANLDYEGSVLGAEREVRGTFTFEEQHEQPLGDGTVSAARQFDETWGSQVGGGTNEPSRGHVFSSQGVASTSRAFWRSVNPPQSPPRSSHGAEATARTPQRAHSPQRPASAGKRVGSAPRDEQHAWELVDEGIRQHKYRAASPQPLSLADVFASAGPAKHPSHQRGGSTRATSKPSPPPEVVDKRLTMYAEPLQKKAAGDKKKPKGSGKPEGSTLGQTAGGSSSATAGGAASTHPTWELRERRLFDVKDKFADKQKHLLETHTEKRVDALRNALR